jgi:hypothetical protein
VLHWREGRDKSEWLACDSQFGQDLYRVSRYVGAAIGPIEQGRTVIKGSAI